MFIRNWDPGSVAITGSLKEVKDIVWCKVQVVTGDLRIWGDKGNKGFWISLREADRICSRTIGVQILLLVEKDGLISNSAWDTIGFEIRERTTKPTARHGEGVKSKEDKGPSNPKLTSSQP